MELATEGKTSVIVNLHEQMTGGFTRDLNFKFPAVDLKTTIKNRVGNNNVDFVEATKIATALMGNSIASNMFMLGYAYQAGLLPVTHDAINKAIELNGASIRMNQDAFLWGRRARYDINAVKKLLPSVQENRNSEYEEPTSLDAVIERRMNYLVAYQNEAYAQKYQRLIDRLSRKEANHNRLDGVAELAANYLFKLMAYKDEYEVARLHSDGVFKKKISEMFEGDYKIKYHLAPPLFSRKDPDTGHLKKAEYGSWMSLVFRSLSRLKFLRGTRFDIFGYTAERRMERQLIKDYIEIIDKIVESAEVINADVARELLALPDEIRGFGQVKEANVTAVKVKWDALVSRLTEPQSQRIAA